MRAVVLRSGQLTVGEVPTPETGPDQIRVAPIATGICGSDLSAWQHTAEFLQASRDSNMSTYLFDPDRDLVMGHEFTGRVLEIGPDVHDYHVDDIIVALPVVIDSDHTVRTVGYSTDYPGGLAEQVVLAGFGHIPVPDGFSPNLAALTEPLTTGTAAVARSLISPPAGAIVTGCGTVGLGALVALAERGIHPIVASDPSESRRQIAVDFGAHAVINPAEDDPVQVWQALAGPEQELVVFEASGARGILNRLLYAVPAFTRILVFGSSMVDETIRPVVGVYKNTTLEFCGGAGKNQDYLGELRKTLNRLVSGTIDGRRLITGYTGLAGGPEAFRLLRPTRPDEVEHIKILIRSDLTGSEIIDPASTDDPRLA